MYMQKDKNDIKIGISKTKAILQIIIVIGLLGVTTWFLTDKVISLPPDFNKTFLIVCCSLLIFTFGLGTISGLRKIFNLDAGLIINKNGIKINIGPNSGQVIKWDQIKSFKTHNPIKGPLCLLIFIKNPGELISSTFGFKRFLIKMNNASHGTPVSITTNFLECDFKELNSLIKGEYKKYVTKH